jgi:hypothetical protein
MARLVLGFDFKSAYYAYKRKSDFRGCPCPVSGYLSCTLNPSVSYRFASLFFLLILKLIFNLIFTAALSAPLYALSAPLYALSAGGYALSAYWKCSSQGEPIVRLRDTCIRSFYEFY